MSFRSTTTAFTASYWHSFNLRFFLPSRSNASSNTELNKLIFSTDIRNKIVKVLFQRVPKSFRKRLLRLIESHAQYRRHTVFCMSITDYPRASVSFPRDRRLGERDCCLRWMATKTNYILKSTKTNYICWLLYILYIIMLWYLLFFLITVIALLSRNH